MTKQEQRIEQLERLFYLQQTQVEQLKLRLSYLEAKPIETETRDD